MAASNLLMIGAVGLFLEAVGIGMMMPGMIPEPQVAASEMSMIRIGVGRWGRYDNESLAGDFPHVFLWDGAGRYIGGNGRDQHPKLDAGGFSDVVIRHEENMSGVQGEYLSIIAAGDDGICINFVTFTAANSAVFGFLGDIGIMCKKPWFYSDVLVINTDSSTLEAVVMLNRTSTCFWIDANHSRDDFPQGIGIHLTDFSTSKDTKEDGRAKQYHKNRESMCNSPPRLKFYDRMPLDTLIPIFWPSLKYNTDNSDYDVNLVIGNSGEPVFSPFADYVPFDYSGGKRRKRRSEGVVSTPTSNEQQPTATGLAGGQSAMNEQKDNKRFMEDVLIKSPLEEHRATVLCNSPTSKGPDFVSTYEGLFCDMENKHLWPICTNTLIHACFDMKLNTLQPAAKGKREINGRAIPKRSYPTEIKWGGLE